MAIDYNALLQRGQNPQAAPSPAVPSYSDQFSQNAPQPPSDTTTPQTPQAPASGGGTANPFEVSQENGSPDVSKYMNVINSGASLEEKKTLLGFLANIPKSAAGVAGGLATAVMHPIKTVENVGNVALGGVEKLAGGGAQTGAWDAFAKQLSDRYGSPKNIANTLYTDPVGAALDLASLAEGGGALVGKLGEAAGLSDVARAGEAARGLGEAANPVGAAIKGAGGIASKVMAPFAEGAKTAADSTAAIARQGMSDIVPVSSLTNSGVVAAGEAAVEKGLFPNDVIARQQATREALAEKANNLTKAATSGTEDPNFIANASQQLHAAFQDTKDAALAVKDKLYEDAVPLIKDVPVKADATLKALQDRLAIEDANPGPRTQIAKDISITLDNLNAMKEQGGPTYNNLKVLRTKLYSKMKDPAVITVGDKAAYKGLYAATSEDLDSALLANEKSIPGITQKMNAANDYNKSVNDTYGSAIGKQLGKADPVGFLDSILKPGDPQSAELAKTMVSASKGSENESLLQGALLKKILERATANGTFDVKGFNAALKEYSPEVIKRILTPEQWSALDDYQKIGNKFQHGMRMGSGSPTAFIGKLAVTTGAIFTNPMLAAKMILGDLAGSKLLNTSWGRQWLTTGFSSAKIANTASKLGRSAKIAAEAGRQLPQGQ